MPTYLTHLRIKTLMPIPTHIIGRLKAELLPGQSLQGYDIFIPIKRIHFEMRALHVYVFIKHFALHSIVYTEVVLAKEKPN